MRTDLPDPTISAADWLMAIMDLEPFCLGDYRELGRAQEPSQGRLWIIESGQQITTGMSGDAVGVRLLDRDSYPGVWNCGGARGNFFSMTAKARAFWRQKIGAGMSPAAILAQWKKAHPKKLRKGRPK